MTLTPEQIEARRHGVGGSELLAALGKDPRCSRLELYMRKVGELPEPDLSNEPRVRMGNKLEPVLRELFMEDTGFDVLVPKQTLQHPAAPLVGNLDGWIPKLAVPVEFKTADKFEADEFGEPGTDQVPIRYLVQCAGYMSLTDAGRCFLAVLVGGNDFRIYEILRDRDLEDAILAGVRDFWRHVEERRPPDPGTPDEVRLRWPKDDGSTAVATAEIVEACTELAEAKLELKRAELREADIKARICQFMGEAAQLVDADGKLLATWRKAKDSQKFDDKRFAKDEPELYEKYLRTQQGSRRFLLK